MIKVKPTPVKSIFKHSNLPPLHNLLNMWAIEDNTLIGLDLQMSCIYEITPPDLNAVPEASVNQFFLAVKNTLHSLPDNTTIQFVLHNRYDISSCLDSYKDISQADNDLSELIINSKIDHFNSLLLNNRSIHMFITVHPDELSVSQFNTGFIKIINKNYKKVTQPVHDNLIKKLKSVSNTITEGFSGAGISAKLLSERDMLEYVYGYLNPSRSSFIDIREINPEQTLRSQVCYNACESNIDNVYLDGYHYRSINMLIRPETAHYTMVYNLYSSLLPDYDLVFTVTSASQEKLFKNLSFNSTVAKNISSFSMFKRNYEAEAKTSEAEDLIEKTKTAHQKLFLYSFSCILRDRSLEGLTTRTNSVVQAFREFGQAEGIIDDMNHLPNFLTVFPGHTHLNFRKHIFQSDAIIQMLPLSLPWKGCDMPKLLFQTKENSLLPLDLFEPSLNVKHSIIIGTSGSGKSFTTNYLLTNFLVESDKNHVVIIDVGGSYRKLASMFDGQYLEVELSERFAFNPFPIKSDAVIDASDDIFEVDADVITFLTQLIQKMLKRPDLNGNEQKIIARAITNAYKYSKSDPPILSSLHYQLMKYSDGDEEDRKIALNFGKNLDVWVNGIYGKMLNRKESVIINSRLVVFDLQKLKDQPELQSVIFFVIRNVIYSKLKDISLRKYIVIDEGWQFFSDPIGALLIIDLYRTARKFNGAVMSISQNPVDFLKSAAADSIISNSPIKYILRLQSDHDTLPKFLLNEKQIEQIRNLSTVRGRYSEVFLEFGGRSTVLRIQPSKVDYWVCTTDPDDFNREQELKQEYPDLSQVEIIKMLAEYKDGEGD
ncbi:MAG: ATP-binding protein [Elusimicrobiota bacterium]